jgi:hypothetical protein
VLALSTALLAQPLRDLAAQRLIHIGAAVDPQYFGETAYAATLSREFNVSFRQACLIHDEAACRTCSGDHLYGWTASTRGWFSAQWRWTH